MDEIRQYNILYSCYGEARRGHEPFVHEHALGCQLSGETDFFTTGGVLTATAGSIGLVKRNQLVKTQKRPGPEGKYMGISVLLDQESLRAYSHEHNVQATGIYTGPPVMALKPDAFLKGYFQSLLPYFEQPEKLNVTLARLKTWEAIELLLRDAALRNLLFDFNEPHKIDLEAYMNRHFMYNVPLSQFARLTGRSLSTFKRDFVKIFGSTPEKWLQQRRLEQAHYLITQRKQRPTDVYLEVGFENLSHFSTAFKKQYGMAPSMAVG